MPKTANSFLYTARREPTVIEWASPTQGEAFHYGPAPMCMSGGFNSSKTYCGCLKVMALSDMFPRNRGVIIRREWEDLQHTTMSTFFKVCPPEAYLFGGQRVDSRKYLRLNNGSEILWMHLRMDNPEIENILKGLEINWFFIDQAEEVEEEMFDKLRSRLGRWDQTIVPEHVIKQHEMTTRTKWPWVNNQGKNIPPTYAMLACNPDVEFHWIYRKFHPDSSEHQNKYEKLGYKMFFMNSLDNKFVTDQSKHEMMAQDESFVRRYVRGEWGIPEGLIHDVSKASIIEYTPELIDWILSTCTLHRILDHGDSAPTACGWMAVDRNGNVIFYREYYEPNKLISYHREEISRLGGKSKDSAGEQYTFNLADPSIFIPTQQKYGGRWTTANEYEDVVNLDPETAIYWQPADNNEFGTRNRISEYLRVDPEWINPFTKQKGAPRLYFIKKSKDYPSGCDQLIKQTRQQRRLKIGTEDGKPVFSDDRDEKVPDHAYDLVRYGIASRPPVSVEGKKLYAKKSFTHIRHQAELFKRRGGHRLLALAARRQRRLS